ncbi:MAG: protein kinase domain-containing protein [Acidobacteriota bacterium]
MSSGLAGRYAIERELGRGGSAVVYLARDLRHERLVAIKVLRPEFAAALGPERFLREISTTAQLRHPHILPLFDSGETNGFLYYVMPFVPGGTLRDRVVREQQLPLDDALRITREVAEALGYAHGMGWVHRDIKPENILLESGQAVVADFGIARAVSAATIDNLTDTGLAVGTVQYMSPEQATGERAIDGRTDQYALATVLYEALAGVPPYTGPSAPVVLTRRMTEPVPPLHAYRAAVPAAVQQAIERALAKSPGDRFDSMTQFVEALTHASAATTPLRRRAALGIAVAAVAIMVIAVWTFRQHPFRITTGNATPVTNSPGVEFQPSLSPDGKQVAFVTDGRLGVSRSVAVGGNGELHPAAAFAGAQSFPAWSPDGEALRFSGCTEGTCGWWEVGRLGGPVRKLMGPREDRGLVWSRDGARAVFARRDSIYVYTARDDSTRLLAVHPDAIDALHSFAWSPDGDRIAYVRGNPFWQYGFNLNPAAIWVIDGIGTRVLVAEGSLNVSPAWLDADHLLFVSDRDGQREIYAVELGAHGPRGAPQKIPGGTDAHSISVSADGSRLAFAKFTAVQHVWSYPLDGRQPLSVRAGRPVTSGTQVVETHNVSHDGRWLIYDTNLGAHAGGGTQIYKMPIAGGTPMLVVESGAGPQLSPDGSEVAFQEDGNWVVPADGGQPVQVVRQEPEHYDNFALWSPDGLHLAFWSNRSGHLETWEVSREGVGGPWSEPRQVTTFGCTIAAWAPDGSGFLCRADPGEREIVLVTLQGAVVWRRDMRAAGLAGMPQFSADGSLIFLEGRAGRAPGIWSWPVAGGAPHLALAFDDPTLRVLTYPGAMEIARDRLYVTVSQTESDIWVMDLKW